MSIQSTELEWRKSLVIAADGTNGGAMSSNVSATSAKNNIFPDVSQAERLAGQQGVNALYRKMFVLVNNSETVPITNHVGLSLIAPKVFVEKQTNGDDMVTFTGGTHIDTESVIDGSEQYYGAGIASNALTGGVTTSIVVDVEDWANANIFTNTGPGSLIRVSDKADINAAGDEEFCTVTAVSVNTNEITLTIAPAIVNTYGAGAKVATVYEPGDVACAVSGFSNGGSGVFSTDGIRTDNTGTVQQTWRILFTGSGATITYDLEGMDGLGVVASGQTTTDLESAINPDTSGKYLRLLASEFTGSSFQAGEQIDFTTSPASIPLWYRRDVPVGATSLSGNSVIVAVDGESS